MAAVVQSPLVAQSRTKGTFHTTQPEMAEAELKKGDVVGKWRLEKPLGTGGQGTVWRARYIDDPHCPAVAIKICNGGSEKARSRFAREQELLKAQNHPGIVRVRDSGRHRGSPFFVMELASTTLAQIAAAESAGTRLIVESRELLLRFIRQTCEAVAHLHGNGILHRDLKPSNILLMLDPPEPLRAVVADLGIAAAESEQGKLTATHETIGTPEFRAPESLTGQHTTRSDVYALGKTIEAVFNRCAPPTLGPGKCRRDDQLATELWDSLDRVLLRACAFDPALRYESASELLDDLPIAVLGLAGTRISTSALTSGSAASLSVPERVALFEAIAACPSPGDHVTAHMLRQKNLRGYSLSMSLRRLVNYGFLETQSLENDFGNPYTAFQPTARGTEWAHLHDADMLAAVAEIAQDPSPPEDDIPF